MKKIILILIFVVFFIGLMAVAEYKHNFKEKYGLNREAVYLPEKAKKLLKQGVNFTDEKDYHNAINKFEELTRLYPKLSVGYYNLGLSYAKENRLSLAIASWEKALKLNPKYANVYYNLGLAYKLSNDSNKAISNFAKYLLLENDDNSASVGVEIEKIKKTYVGTDNIGRILFSDKANTKSCLIENSKILFKPDTKKIFANVEIANLPEHSKLKAIWYYSNFEISNVFVNSTQLVAGGSKTMLLSIDKPIKGWPIGWYDFEIYVDGKQEASTSFYIYSL